MNRQHGRPWDTLRLRWLEAAAAMSLAVSVSVGYLLAAQAHAAESGIPQKPPTLREASQNNSLVERTVSAGRAVLSLRFDLDPLANTPVKVRVVATEFSAEEAPFNSLTPSLSAPQRVGASKDTELAVALTPENSTVSLEFNGVRPKTTYKGKLTLFSTDKPRSWNKSWDIILKSADFPTLVVDKIAPQQLVINNPFSEKRHPPFTITLRARSGDGPYTELRVKVEDPNQSKSTGIRSSFTADALSFWKDCAECMPLDLWSSGIGSSQGSDQGDKKDEVRSINQGSQKTIWVRVNSLGAGEYNPILRFMADGASETTEESKLALTIQIRHHWAFPVLVILLGSLAGWIGSKYFAADRTARSLRVEVNALSSAAAFLARPDPYVGGWRFPSEAHSYALARVRVILHQVEHLTKKALVVYAAEQEIRDRLADARRRLDALSALRTKRQDVQPWANERPAAQQAIGRTLRRVLNLLDQPAFGDAQKKAVDEGLNVVSAWLNAEQRETLYRDAVLVRLAELEGIAPAEVSDECLSNLIMELQRRMPRRDEVQRHSIHDLTNDDRLITRLWLLWRDRRMSWVTNREAPVGDQIPLEDLYHRADMEVWRQLEDAANRGEIRCERVSSREQEETYDLVEVRLRLYAEGLTESRLAYHPCVIRWLVTPQGGSPRTIETDHLTLVQYFPEPGPVTIEAWLRWEGNEIRVPMDDEFIVVKNKEYQRLRAAFKGWPVELCVVTPLAMFFAILTGLQTKYDATFGSLGEYSDLFLWASGASTGGNLFKQLATGRTAGGQEATQSGK